MTAEPRRQPTRAVSSNRIPPHLSMTGSAKNPAGGVLDDGDAPSWPDWYSNTYDRLPFCVAPACRCTLNPRGGNETIFWGYSLTNAASLTRRSIRWTTSFAGRRGHSPSDNRELAHTLESRCSIDRKKGAPCRGPHRHPQRASVVITNNFANRAFSRIIHALGPSCQISSLVQENSKRN